MKFQTCTFQTDFSDWWWRHLFWNCPNMNVTGLHWWSVNIGSGNGLVPSGTKPGLHWWSVNIGSGNGLVPSGTKPGLHWWSVNIGSGNGLVPSGTEPLPAPVLTQICRHMVSLGHNELSCICLIAMKFILYIAWLIYQASSYTNIPSHVIPIMADFITWIHLFRI